MTMASFCFCFVELGREDAKTIDELTKNKWNWGWSEKELCKGTDEHLLSDCIKKVDQPGVAYCEWCKEIIKYGSSGLKAMIRRHADTKLN
jgi:hypothetical protein